MKEYNNDLIQVLWVEDDTNVTNSYPQKAEDFNLELVPFPCWDDAKIALENDFDRWSAIILDAKCKYHRDSADNAVEFLREALMGIAKICEAKKRVIPWYVLTGGSETEVSDSINDERLAWDADWTESHKKKYYSKNTDNEDLYRRIKDHAQKSTRFLTKTKYLDAIEQLESFDTWCCEKILDILEAMHFPEKDIDPLLYYNPLRQTLEYIFRKANKAGIIPDEFIGKEKDDVNLNQCVQFLSGGNADRIGIRFGGVKESVVPVHIKNMMFQVLNLGNVNSHSRALNNDEQKKLDSYFKENVCNSQYLIYSLALQICEIAVFMGKYIAAHNDSAENKKQFKTFGTIERIEGHESICVIKSKRPGRESCICISEKYVSGKGLIGKNIVVLEESENTNSSTKADYPYFAAKIQSLEKENGSK